jgi:DedD protein
MVDYDVQLQLEKRARRRLVGAVAFVSVVALGLPMVMDHEPRQAVPDVEIRIPGQDDQPFAPRFAAEPAQRPAAKPAPVAPTKSDEPPSARVVDVTRGQDEAKPAPKAADKPVAKTAEKPAAKPAEKPAEKPEKPAAMPDEGKRAAAILAGRAIDAPAANAAGEYLVLIGAFSNEANVRNLKSKLGEQGIKVYSEPLDTPQGRKTRVRAGPFASREAAEKALAKMQKIGVSGVVAPRQ